MISTIKISNLSLYFMQWKSCQNAAVEVTLACLKSNRMYHGWNNGWERVVKDEVRKMDGVQIFFCIDLYLPYGPTWLASSLEEGKKLEALWTEFSMGIFLIKGKTHWQSVRFLNSSLLSWFYKILKEGACSHKKEHSTHDSSWWKEMLCCKHSSHEVSFLPNTM